jgi:hypothetical protein
MRSMACSLAGLGVEMFALFACCLPQCLQVHVLDVCSALWHVAMLPSSLPVYNLCDHSDSSQVRRLRNAAHTHAC